MTISNAQSTSANQQPKLTLTFFKNTKGAPVANLALGERRLLATTHPATIVAAMFAMDMTELTVATSVGSHTGQVQSLEADDNFWPLTAINMRLQLNRRLYQFRHLAASADQLPLLEGLDLFSYENWHSLTDVADEHLRAAHHHLPKDLIKRRLTTPAPMGWKKTLKNRNGFIYFPYC